MNDYVLLTATDKARFNQALNLVGSIARKSPGFAEVIVYDLGLTWYQRWQLRGIQGVTLRKVPAFTDHWRQCWSWKPWIWTHAQANKVIYLDAGIEVLRSLKEMCDLVDTDGYLLVSQHETLEQGHTLKDIIPEDYYKLLGVSRRLADKPVVAAGIIGFRTKSDFFEKVIKPTYDLVLKGYNLGWSENELSRNTGLNKLPKPILRDCTYFRHDQTLLNAMIYSEIAKPVIQPIAKFGGYKSPYEHPEQLIWNSRLQSPLSYIDQIEYHHAQRLRNRLNRLYVFWYYSRVNKLFNRVAEKSKRIIGIS